MVSIKKILIFLLVIIIVTSSLVYARGVYQNYEEIEDIQKGKTTTPLGVIIKSFVSGFKQILSDIFSFGKTSIPVINKTDLNQTLSSKGTILHYALKQNMTREVNFGDKKANLTLINPMTWEGAIFKFNDKILKLSSGTIAYEDGFILIRKGNRKVNKTVEAKIEIMYVGEDRKDCPHIQCFEGNLHWFYCNGSNFGIIQECDLCEDNECTPKGFLSRIIKQDSQIEYEKIIEEKIEKGKEIDCIHISGTGIGKDCLD